MKTRREIDSSVCNLVPAYEELRSVMVSQRPGGSTPPGLGILLMRGMAAWIDVASSPVTDAPVVIQAQGIQRDPARLPIGTAGAVANVLASMTMDALWGVAI